MRVVIAPDKFKGTLSAKTAADAISKGVRSVRPDAEIDLIPLADGGEGTSECLCEMFEGEYLTTSTHGPLNEPVHSSFAMLPDGSAVIDMAAATGLNLVDPSPRTALDAGTFGTGELMLEATKAGAKRLLVGVGGSASTDGGTGAANAFGWQFLDAGGSPIPTGGGGLVKLARVVAPEHRSELEVVGICDVLSPLTGVDGAARVFSPQKGASPEQVELLEEGIGRLAEIVRADLGVDVASALGAGAGGGMGAGLLAFFGASLRSGAGYIAEISRLESRVQAADLVITGEGEIDRQTPMGKIVDRVADVARKHAVPCAAIGGRVDERVAADLELAPSLSLERLVGTGRAFGDPTGALAYAAAQIVEMVSGDGLEAY